MDNNKDIRIPLFTRGRDGLRRDDTHVLVRTHIPTCTQTHRQSGGPFGL